MIRKILSYAKLSMKCPAIPFLLMKNPAADVVCRDVCLIRNLY